MKPTYSPPYFYATDRNVAWEHVHSSVEPYSGILLAVSSAACGALFLHMWSTSERTTPIRARSVIEERSLANIQKAYRYVFGGFALTALFATAAHVNGVSQAILKHSSLVLPLFFATSAALCATLRVNQENTKTKHIAWILFNAGMGTLFSPFACLDRTLLVQAGAISLTLGGGLSLLAHLDPKNRLKAWERPLLASLSCLSLFSGVAYFFPKTAFAYGLDRLSTYGGLMVFSLLFMASTQKLVEQSEQEAFDPLKASLDLYLDGMNLFAKLVKILWQQAQEAKKNEEKKAS